MGSSYSSSDEIIACIGPAGSGKSRIIDCLAGTKWASSSLKHETREVRSTKIKVNKNTVVLIDTPGFDAMSHTEFIYQIESWLKKKYNKSAGLTGIIYLHPISDNRMTKETPPDLKRLLAPDASNVVLVTTMWNKKLERAEQREKELHESYWKTMLDCGAQTDRFDDKEMTASRIVNRLLGNN